MEALKGVFINLKGVENVKVFDLWQFFGIAA